MSNPENDESRRRLIALIERTGDAALRRSLGGGWTVAVALAHLAAWDARAALTIEHWQHGEIVPPGEPAWTDDIFNRALLPQWQALPPAEAARLALEAAILVDGKVAELDTGTVQSMVTAGEEWLLHRHRHRQEHLEQIEAALSRQAPATGNS